MELYCTPKVNTLQLNSQKLFEHTYTSDLCGLGTLTARAVRQVTRRWPPACRSNAASKYAVGVLSPLISPSKALCPELTGATALPTHLPPVPMALGRPRPR
jgi:hypothetical protein